MEFLWNFPLFDGAEQGKSGSAVCTYVHFYFIIAKKPVREDGLSACRESLDTLAEAEKGR